MVDAPVIAPFRRFAGLDGLRAFAVLLVVWHNWGALPFTRRFGRAGELRAGYIGVSVFFVISGFLITHLLLDEVAASGRVRISAFYVRRAYRLLPALLLTLILLIATGARRHHPWSDTAHATATALGYIFNLAAERAPVAKPLGGAGWGHLWSLSVEEQFYLVWPVLIGLLARRWSPKAVTCGLVAASCAITAWRTHLWLDGASFFRLYLLTDVRCDAILLGAASAVALRTFPGLRLFAGRVGWTLGPLLIGVLVLAHRGSSADPAAPPGWLVGPGTLVVSVAAVLMVLIAVTESGGRVQRVLDCAPVAAIGRRSYGIYLFHYPLEAITANLRGGWFLALGSTVALTEISYRFVELPVLRRLPASAFRRPIGMSARHAEVT